MASRVERSRRAGSGSPSVTPTHSSNSLANKSFPKVEKKPGSVSSKSRSPNPNNSGSKIPLIDSPKVEVELTSPSKTGRFTHQGTAICPCGGTKPDSWKIDCSKCSQIWHADCISLDGISKDSISKMLNYLCPFCYVPPVPGPRTASSPYVCHTCLNTATVRDINQWSCIDSLSSKINSIESLGDGLTHVEELDSRIKHLLTNINSLNESGSKEDKLDGTITALSNKIDELNQALNNNNASDSDPLITSSGDNLKLQALEENLSKINQKLDKFIEAHEQNVCVSASNQQSSPSSANTPFNTPLAQSSHHSPLKANPDTNYRHETAHINHNIQNYVSIEELEKITQFIDTVGFAQEKGHETAMFGETYKYMGANSKCLPIPDVLKELIGKLNQDFTDGSQNQLNSCLINRYVGNQSHIAEHSDNEFWINPTSSIFTLALGSTRTIRFKDTKSGTELEYESNHNSLYSMTRDSQNFFRHRIDPEVSPNDEIRISLTFRSTHWTYLNSTCFVGDSNFKKVEFGSGKGKMGAYQPGVNTRCYTIEDFDPLKCLSYKNVVLMMGTNNLRSRDMNSREKIRELFCLYKSKIKLIQMLNKKCNIFVCPVLPTKLAVVNSKIFYFNTLLRSDLTQSSFGVTIVDGLELFLDSRGQLNSDLAYPGDDLHINGDGASMLVKLIKDCIFREKVKKGKFANRTSDKSYANIVRGSTSHML